MTAGPSRYTAVLEPHAASVREARASVRKQLADWGLAEHTDIPELLVSELVTNVLRHAPGRCTLALTLTGSVLTSEVTDGSPHTPRLVDTADTDEGGRGLQLVDALADAWGFRREGPGKTIWFRLALDPPPP